MSEHVRRTYEGVLSIDVDGWLAENQTEVDGAPETAKGRYERMRKGAEAMARAASQFGVSAAEAAGAVEKLGKLGARSASDWGKPSPPTYNPERCLLTGPGWDLAFQKGARPRWNGKAVSEIAFKETPHDNKSGALEVNVWGYYHKGRAFAAVVPMGRPHLAFLMKHQGVYPEIRVIYGNAPPRGSSRC